MRDGGFGAELGWYAEKWVQSGECRLLSLWVGEVRREWCGVVLIPEGLLVFAGETMND
jgi:hypothetical protein